MNKVYVVFYGQYVYEDNSTIQGVFNEEQKALDFVKDSGRVPYSSARWGQCFFTIEEWDVQ